MLVMDGLCACTAREVRLLAYEVGDGVLSVTDEEDEMGEEGVLYSSSSEEDSSSTSQKLKVAADITATNATVGRYDTVRREVEKSNGTLRRF